MAQKKSPGGTKKTTKKTTAPAKKTAQAPKPIRREVGAAVCLMLGMISFLEYFKVNAWLVNGFSKVIKGLFGWGFLAVPVCFFWAAWILFFHKGRPISWRLLCVSLIPLNFGAIVHLIAYKDPYVYDVVGVQNMFWTGVEMKSGGVISSAIADLLRGALSVYGALPLLLVLISALILCGARVSLKKAVEDIKAHEYPPYEPEPEPDPEQFEPLPTRPLRAPARPSLREDIDIPIDADEKKPGKRAKPTSDKNRRSSWIDIPIDDIPEEESRKRPSDAATIFPICPRASYTGAGTQRRIPQRSAIRDVTPSVWRPSRSPISAMFSRSRYRSTKLSRSFWTRAPRRSRPCRNPPPSLLRKSWIKTR